MNILGLIAVDVGGHPSACLLMDGKLITFAEEERFIRVKRAKGFFPVHALKFCLAEGKLSMDDIDCIAFGWDAPSYQCKFPLQMGLSYCKSLFSSSSIGKSKPTVSRQENLGAAIISGINSLVSFQPKSIKEKIILGLKDAGYVGKRIPPIKFFVHHMTHAATAFYCSGFPEAAVLVIDGHGEENTITFYKGRGREIELLREINIPNSLGWFYSMLPVTETRLDRTWIGQSSFCRI